MSKLVKLIISLLIPQAAAAIGSFLTTPYISPWYPSLNKPNLAPPNWLFAPVWATLFVLMGISLYLIWTAPGSTAKKIAYLIFAVQLILNVTWSGLFFALQKPLWAGIEIIILWVTILFNILNFASINKLAGWLLVPYLLWVSFAAYLNWQIVLLN